MTQSVLHTLFCTQMHVYSYHFINIYHCQFCTHCFAHKHLCVHVYYHFIDTIDSFAHTVLHVVHFEDPLPGDWLQLILQLGVYKSPTPRI